jgi:DNA polymerase III sliding clamp (beta) subunit (PCNA family)
MSIQIDRETFLNDLQMVKGGLSAREFTEQSSCFVFKEGWVMTFNDEVACRKKIQPTKLHGAVPATRLLEILDKIEDPKLRVGSKDGELIFRGKKKGFAVTKEKSIVLPIDQVESPGEWRALPTNFADALGRVKKCVSGDETKFILTCVHLHPEFIEACDSRQLFRHRMDLGLKEAVLVRGVALNEIVALEMDHISITESWIHFKKEGKDGNDSLIYSCRKYAEPFPDLNSVLKIKGRNVVIPRGLQMTAERAGVFADDSSSGEPWVTVTMSPGRMVIRGEGNSGRYWENKKIDYEGPEISFIINPSLLRDIAETYKNARVSENLLKVTGGKSIEEGGKWEYVARLGKMDDKEEKDADEESPKKKVGSKKKAE